MSADCFKILFIKKFNGGETGIRTQERVAPLPVFKTGAFNRSAISPTRVSLTFYLQTPFYLKIVQSSSSFEIKIKTFISQLCILTNMFCSAK